MKTSMMKEIEKLGLEAKARQICVKRGIDGPVYFDNSQNRQSFKKMLICIAKSEFNKNFTWAQITVVLNSVRCDLSRVQTEMAM